MAAITKHDLQEMASVDELAVLMRVKRTAVYDWVRDGKIEPTRFGRKMFFTPKAIAAFRERCAKRQVSA